MKIGQGTKIWNPELSNIQDCQIGDNCRIHSHVWIGEGVIIGNNVKIQAFSFIPSGVIIEDNAFIGPRVTFTNDPKLEISGPSCWAKTIVKRGAKIGASVTIVAGVTIGENSRIGAGAVVTRDIPPNVVACGVPAKVMAGKTP
jgi:UDP-2-acetamido-3-amino-2,3-dideoxy-glucuronate N-acetyltransferase